MEKIAIIGAGKGGSTLIKALGDKPNIKIVAVCDVDPGAPGLVEAKRRDIPVYSDYARILTDFPDIGLVVNVTGDERLTGQIAAKAVGADVVSGSGARFIYEIADSYESAIASAERRMDELKDLYELGLKLSSSSDLREVYSTIIEYAMLLTDTPAGSIAILDENTCEMTLAAAKGFSQSFFSFDRWTVRQGGLTSHILNQEHPIIIPDATILGDSVNPALLDEGVKSIIATPLTVRGKIIGILYVDDFKHRDFTENEASILGLLAGYAALAIEKMKLLDDTRKMAITDGLTGLFNQQEFIKRLEEETSRAARYGRPLSIVELDIDYFKLYNDQYGHLAGNDLLKILSSTLAHNSRATDLCARTGGEEFAVIMPETEFKEAMRLSERFRKLVEALDVSNGNKGRRVTISVGVASYPTHGSSSMELYHAVDMALYKAKQTGRNRVVGYPDCTVSTIKA